MAYVTSTQGGLPMTVAYAPAGSVGPAGTVGTPGFVMQTDARKVKYEYASCFSCSCWPVWIWCLTTTLLSLLLILIMQQLNFGRVVTESEGFDFPFWLQIGNSEGATKCVEVPMGVYCPADVERHGKGEWPDTFHIYHDGVGRVCAHRVDHEGGWGLDLSLECHIRPTSIDESARVAIGSTLDTHATRKCVDAPPGVVCDNSAAQLGRTGQWHDTFDITMVNGQVCVHRTDRPAAWGLDLVLQCRKGTVAHDVTFTNIIIGNTLDTHAITKCVADPGNVICDNAAEQLGRDGRWKDKFNIYHKEGEICAHRIDSKGAWGLNLVLRCKNKLHTN